MSADLLELARHVEKRSRDLGAQEASATVSRVVHTSLQRRDGKVEQVTESTSRGLVFSVYVDGRYSSHSTSDLRPEAIEAFLGKTIAATRYLEEDPDRRLPDASLCGRGASDEQLDQLDPAYARRTADERARHAEQLEGALREIPVPGALSRAVSIGDGFSETARALSNGFSDVSCDAWFTHGGEMTLQDGTRRPEASAGYATRYLADLPGIDLVAAEVVQRAKERIGSGPIASGTYPMVLLNRAAPKMLGVLVGPASGGALHQKRSILADKMGQRIASEKLTLVDDPTVPRGLASRPWDGDGLVARPRTIIENGVLRSFYINVYYSRKLGMPPTTGGRSNWIVPGGERSLEDIVRELPKAILVDGFLGGNSNAATGQFSFGIRGALLEHGVRTRSLSEMNVGGDILGLFDRLVELGNDPYRWSSARTPTMLFDGVQFSGS